MFYRPPLYIRVCVDVACKSHLIAVGLSTGEVIVCLNLTFKHSTQQFEGNLEVQSIMHHPVFRSPFKSSQANSISRPIPRYSNPHS